MLFVISLVKIHSTKNVYEIRRKFGYMYAYLHTKVSKDLGQIAGRNGKRKRKKEKKEQGKLINRVSKSERVIAGLLGIED